MIGARVRFILHCRCQQDCKLINNTEVADVHAPGGTIFVFIILGLDKPGQQMVRCTSARRLSESWAIGLLSVSE